MPASFRLSAVSAETDIGTSANDCERFCAVTMTSSNSACAAAPQKMLVATATLKTDFLMLGYVIGESLCYICIVLWPCEGLFVGTWCQLSTAVSKVPGLYFSLSKAAMGHPGSRHREVSPSRPSTALQFTTQCLSFRVRRDANSVWRHVSRSGKQNGG